MAAVQALVLLYQQFWLAEAYTQQPCIQSTLLHAACWSRSTSYAADPVVHQ
jgi:hypothetical protein